MSALLSVVSIQYCTVLYCTILLHALPYCAKVPPYRIIKYFTVLQFVRKYCLYFHQSYLCTGSDCSRGPSGPKMSPTLTTHIEFQMEILGGTKYHIVSQYCFDKCFKILRFLIISVLVDFQICSEADVNKCLFLLIICVSESK